LRKKVASEVHLADDTGAANGAEPIPDAQRVELGELRVALIHVCSGYERLDPC